MKRRDDFTVGLTIIVGIVVLIAAILWVKQADLGHRRHDVVARFRDVGNVRVGSPVVVRGVRAGRVESMELAPNGFVQLHLAIDPSVTLPEQPVVLLNESSLFGEWQATILSRDAVGRDEDVLRQLGETTLADGVLPGATLPDIARLTAVAGQIAGDVASVAERVRTAFDEQAAREMRLSIRNFADLSSALAQTVREQSKSLDTMSTDVRTGVRSLVRSAELMRAVAERVDSSTARGEVGRIVEDAGEAARQLRETGRRLAAISEQLGRSQDRLAHVLSASDSIVTRINSGQGSLGLMINDPSLYHHSDSLMVQLSELLADIRKNPRRYFSVRIF